MSTDASQEAVPDQAVESPQPVSEAPGQSDQKTEPATVDENHAEFKAMLQRGANMTPEEWEKRYPNWPPPPQGSHQEALDALEEAEAPEEDSDDAGETVTQNGSTESVVKAKGS